MKIQYLKYYLVIITFTRGTSQLHGFWYYSDSIPDMEALLCAILSATDIQTFCVQLE